MLIQLDDPTLAADLCAHYTRSGFQARAVGEGVVEADRPETVTNFQVLRDLVLHLRIWQVVNPEANATLIGGQGRFARPEAPGAAGRAPGRGRGWLSRAS